MKRVFTVTMVAVLIVAAVLVTAAPALAAKYTPGVWTGKSAVQTSDVRVSFSFQLHDALGQSDALKVTWGHDRFQLTQLTQVEVDEDPSITPEPPAVKDFYDGWGVGECNGAPGFHVEFIFTDAGKPGIHDWAWIKIADPSGVTVLEASGFLVKGNTRAG